MARSRGNHASHEMNGHGKTSKVEEQPFVVRLSVWFVLVCFLCASSFAFAVGRLAVTLFLNKHPIGAVLFADGNLKVLPPPLFSEKKPIPHTVYSSKHFATPGVATSDTLLARRPGINDPSEFMQQQQPQQKDVYMDGSIPETLSGSDEEVHEPAGQHLLIDIRNVDGVFLNSDDRLARAMVDLIEMSGLTMLSYHCHGLEPIGVSCVGVLLESHISFHTWPIPGVILLDLFTCGPKPLLPLLPIIEKLFGVPKEQDFQGQEIEKPHMRWAHKRRGFRNQDGNPEESADMHQFILGLIDLDMKELVVLEQSPFQTVEIYDVINPRFLSLESYHKSLEQDGSYHSLHPQFFRPERIVFLDGIMQSRLRGETAYHDVLVHPAMFAHKNPKRVAIIGGGEGATLREVLKHKSVEKVTMIEIDETVVNVSRKYIPEWNDCSNLVGSAKSCFDDPRAEIIYTDAIVWFIDRYSNQRLNDPYDVIIMDALDPSSVVAFSDVLYNNDALAQSISNALGANGILVSQLGEVTKLDHPPQQKGMKVEELFYGHLVRQGFQLLTQFQEAHGNFLATWKFLIAFKNRATFSNWNSNQAEFDALIHSRIMQTFTGEPALRFFDGATMMTLHYPDRIMEEVFCKNQPKPFLCNQRHGFDPEFSNSPITSFNAKKRSMKSDGAGLFTNTLVTKNSLIAIDEDVQYVSVMPSTGRLLRKFLSTDVTGKWRAFSPHMEMFPNDYYGEPEYSLVIGKKQFINHGCNGTFNIIPLISPLVISESAATPNNIPEDLLRTNVYSAAYNTAVRRTHMLYRNPTTFAMRDIQNGEELLQNGLNKLSQESWTRGVLLLQEQCENETYDEDLPAVSELAAETSTVQR